MATGDSLTTIASLASGGALVISGGEVETSSVPDGVNVTVGVNVNGGRDEEEGSGERDAETSGGEVTPGEIDSDMETSGGKATPGVIVKSIMVAVGVNMGVGVSKPSDSEGSKVEDTKGDSSGALVGRMVKIGGIGPIPDAEGEAREERLGTTEDGEGVVDGDIESVLVGVGDSLGVIDGSMLRDADGDVDGRGVSDGMAEGVEEDVGDIGAVSDGEVDRV